MFGTATPAIHQLTLLIGYLVLLVGNLFRGRPPDHSRNRVVLR